MEHSLEQGLPIKRNNWELIDWFYRLPLDHEIFTVTRRRQSLKAVIENLRSEPQKIRSARQATGREGSLSLVERTGWTLRRREAAQVEFPELVLPERFQMLAPDIQQRITKRMAMYEVRFEL
jgi:hypothetical protein